MGNFKRFEGLKRFLVTDDGKFCSTCCSGQLLTECPGNVGDALCDNCAASYQLTSGTFRIDWAEDYPCIGDSGCYVEHQFNRQLDKAYLPACGSTCLYYNNGSNAVVADDFGCTSGHFDSCYAALSDYPPGGFACIGQSLTCGEHPDSGELVWGITVRLYCELNGTQPVTCVGPFGAVWTYFSDSITAAAYCPTIDFSFYSETQTGGGMTTTYPNSITIS